MGGRRVRLAAFVLVVLAVIILLAIHAQPRKKASTPAASPYKGTGAVGALLARNHNVIFPIPFCTATVVNSPAGNLILTAAHCLGRIPPSKMIFVPGYRGNSHHRYPYGIWRVTGQNFPPHWFPNGNASIDFAFLTVSGDVQARTGGETLGTSSPAPSSVQLIGYTWKGGYPLACTRRPATITVAGQQQMKFTCAGYVGAASGGPFLVNVSAKTGNGTVIGVIGGYQDGGYLPSISYSSPFGAAIKALYNRVTRNGR
ncbi:MAG TPA: trypsin-like serine protease [Streptosporangiaceae bacterium]